MPLPLETKSCQYNCSRDKWYRRVMHAESNVWGEGNTKSRTLLGNLPLALQIALVSYHRDWEVVLVLDPQDLLLECHDLLKRLPRRDGVDEQETLACAHVLLPHR